MSGASGSREGSRHGARELRRAQSEDVLHRDIFEPYKPEQVLDAVYEDDQPTIDAIIAHGGAQEVRGAIIWRVSKETIRKLYAEGLHDKDFYNILFSAARFGHPDVLETLLDHTGLTVHTLERHDHHRNSLLYIASQAGHVDIVRNLLKRGANIHEGRFIPGLLVRHKEHVSCLETAVYNGHAAVARLLLEHHTPSHRALTRMLNIAIREADRSCVQVLLQCGAKPNQDAQDRIAAMRDPLLVLAMRQALAA